MKITQSVLDEMRNEITKRLSGNRLTHSLAVEQEAYALGTLFGFNDEQLNALRAAAILHDITKGWSVAEQIDACQKRNITLTLDDIKSPKVLHSITGASVAKELFPEYVDDTIYNAILYHTTGKLGMSLFEKLIYLADYIEPTRTFPDCVELRSYFYESDTLPTEKHLNKTLLISFDMTLKNLLEEKRYIHLRTAEARNGILNELSKVELN